MIFFAENPAIWVNTQRGVREESFMGTSFYNMDEVDKVGMLLDKLAAIEDKEYLKSLSVGVITFYKAQLSMLKKEYSERESEFGEGKLVFGTVDSFQGRECDIVICSLVRNNKNGNIGFAIKPNRINVAFSRARKALVILGSENLFAHEARDERAKDIYRNISEKCYRPQPEELL